MAKIELQNVGITFNAYQHKRKTLTHYARGGLAPRPTNKAVQVRPREALTLPPRAGARTGVIAPKGAGKTTLLKTLAGVSPPTTGTREVEGRICSLFDIT